MFAMHRIEQYQILPDTFEPMDQERLDQWLQSPLFIEHQQPSVDVSVHFDPRAARYIKEKTWHESQRLENHDDGSCTLTFPTCGLDEVRRWILTFGPEAQVLQPEELKQLIISDLKSALARY